MQVHVHNLELLLIASPLFPHSVRIFPATSHSLRHQQLTFGRCILLPVVLELELSTLFTLTLTDRFTSQLGFDHLILLFHLFIPLFPVSAKVTLSFHFGLF